MREYILDEKNQPVLSDTAWQWMQEHPHRKTVSVTRFPDGTRVSTVFLILDHGWNGGPPTLWETMVFDSPEGSEYGDGWQDRYTSYADAVAGHIKVVADILKEGVPVSD